MRKMTNNKSNKVQETKETTEIAMPQSAIENEAQEIDNEEIDNEEIDNEEIDNEEIDNEELSDFEADSNQKDDVLDSMIKENELLKEQLASQALIFEKQMEEFKAMMANMTVKNDETPKFEPDGVDVKTSEETHDEYIDIRPDKYIRVMSLTPELLNLNAGANSGSTKIIRFQGYGEVRNIVYSDLSNIVVNHQRLAEDGAFYIFDKDVIKVMGLSDHYNKILDKKGLEDLLTKDIATIKKVMLELSENQQKAIVNIVLKDILDEKNVSSMVINTVDEICSVKVMEMVDEMQNFDATVDELLKA